MSKASRRLDKPSDRIPYTTVNTVVMIYVNACSRLVYAPMV